jgi:Transposase DDE domain
VATQDTVTLIRSAIRGLLREADAGLAQELRGCCKRDDDYRAPGKPSCDWDDPQAREALIDALARDAYAILAALDSRSLAGVVMQAAQLLATVVGQDLELSEQGVFRIARRVAKNRVISTVDPEARHGHKTAARSFDGYKGHIAVDPDSELITATAVSAGNAGDGEVAEQLLADVLAPQVPTGDPSVADRVQCAAKPAVQVASEPVSGKPACQPVEIDSPTAEPKANQRAAEVCESGEVNAEEGSASATAEVEPGSEPRFECYGDAAYGVAKLIERVEAAGGEANFKVQPACGRNGKFSKDQFDIDLEKKTVTCPAGKLVVIG